MSSPVRNVISSALHRLWSPSTRGSLSLFGWSVAAAAVVVLNLVHVVQAQAPEPEASPAAPVSEPAVAAAGGREDKACEQDITIAAGESREHPSFLMGQTITVDGTVEDLFGLAKEIRLQGAAQDNVFALAQDLVLEKGQVAGDVLALAKNVTLKGVVAGDVYVAAESLRVEGEVQGDVHAAGQNITLAQDAIVQGDLKFAGEDIRLDGKVGGRVHGAGGKVALNGRLASDVDVKAGEISVGPEARLEGDFHTTSPEVVDIPATAFVAGRVSHDEPPPTPPREASEDEGGMGFTVFLFLSSLLTGLLLIWAAGAGAMKPTAALRRQPAVALGLGFVLFACVPFVAILVLFTVIGIPLGLLALMLYPVALYVARLVASHCLGDLLMRRVLRRESVSPYLAFVVGLLGFYLVTSIPVLGVLAWLGLVVAGLGATFMALASRPSASVAPPPMPSTTLAG